MSAVPAGTRTFLFTDIEGSTRLWEQHPDEMGSCLRYHDSALRRIIESNDGVVFKTVGDGFCASFSTATGAVVAAVRAQQHFLEHTWEIPEKLRVRMALHTGEAEERDNDFFGPAVNRVARLMAAGHGGQILLSQVTADIVRRNLPADFTLRDSGRHRLKDLTHPEPIFQLEHPDLPRDFPPLNTLSCHPNNLPHQPTPIIGREKELQTSQSFLLNPTVRILTLTGPGGIGKTRLGLQIAANVIEEFVGGVFFLDLAAETQTSGVFLAIARTLGIDQRGTTDCFQSICSFIRETATLLILDNFEQVVDAAVQVAGMLAACRYLKLLITSREALRVRAEHVFVVPPLSLPKLNEIGREPDRLFRCESIQLFAARAIAGKPSFALTRENVRTVAEICLRLDGLPLAIELAAVRIRALTLQAVLKHLGNRLRLLTGGHRDLPDRQRTLRATIDWSYELLSERDRMCFRRLSVFIGGFDMAAAEAVLGPSDGWEVDDVLGDVSSLVEKSLVSQDEPMEGEPRFTILQTLREYGLERLTDTEELSNLQAAHASHYLSLAEETELHVAGPEEKAWMERLDMCHENLIAALIFLESRRDAETTLRMAGALAEFWVTRGQTAEGREWLAPAEDSAIDLTPAVRAKALAGAGRLACCEGDFTRSERCLEASLLLYRQIGSARDVATVSYDKGLCYFRLNRLADAQACFEDCRKTALGIDSSVLVAKSDLGLGDVAWRLGRPEEARVRFERSMRTFGEIGDRKRQAQAIGNLGALYFQQRQYDRARACFEETLQKYRDLGDRQNICPAYNNLGFLSALTGEHEKAIAHYAQLVDLSEETRNRPMLCAAHCGIAESHLACQDVQKALTHAIKAQKVASTMGTPFELGISSRVAGEVYLELGEVKQAQRHFLTSIPLLEEARYDEEAERARDGLQRAQST